MQSLGGILSYINVIVDISIVSYIIYKVLTLLRGTRAVQLLKGITTLLLIWLVSNFLHLDTLRWLVKELFSVGAIALIIIFQPELRRALEQLGRGHLLTRVINAEEAAVKVVSEVVKAVSYLAEHQVGALIVLERETGLSDYIETGVGIEGRLSSELLKNIFSPNTPLHDGAVIIRNDQLAAASCYLPLSENPSIHKELGTRHRAGIGMSEVSDAVTVIVSEETGQISLAIHGVLERGLSEEKLLARLYDELKPSVQTLPSFWMRLRKEEKNRG